MSEKEAYAKKLQAQMDEWVAEIHRLKAMADQAEADAQIKYYEEIEKLKQHQKQAQARMAELSKASEEAWEDLRSGMEQAWANFGDAVKSAAARFK